MNQPGFSAILLAAGASRRMGVVNKLTLPIGGVPLLRRSAQVLLGAALDEIVVVLGHQGRAARTLLADLPLTLVLNRHYRAGRQTSVHQGLRSLGRRCRAVMICLADLPLLESSDIDALIHAYDHDCPRPILVPDCNGRRGNPIIISSRQRKAILVGGGALTCRGLIDGNPDLVWRYRAANDHFCVDLDTLADQQRLLARLAGRRDAGVQARRA